MIFWFDRLDSTNNAAKALQEHFDNLSVIAAECQYGGRGQGAHSWTAEPGACLAFSVILKFGDANPLRARDAVVLTQIATGAVRKFLQGIGIQSRIKWPNDIYVDGRKICGILIENTLRGADVHSSVIGIGLNLNQSSFPSDLPNPVSAYQLTGNRFNMVDSMRTLYSLLEQEYEKTKSLRGREALKGQFEEALLPTGNEAAR